MITDLRAVKADLQQLALHAGLTSVYHQRPECTCKNHQNLQAFQLAQLQSLLTRDGDTLKIERTAVSYEIKISAALGDNNRLRAQDESNIKAGCAHRVTARSFMTLSEVKGEIALLMYVLISVYF